ncbi:MAG TPA: lytic transglycosylase domain-containing protein [Candidatus Baltobacteraceae bacterium]|jgi:soluble lytic murein transglycosylase-like protein
MMTAHSAVIVLYARALQYFNPNLHAGTAATLASATIAQSDRERIDARLLVALIAVESRWNPGAVSSAGARGLGQLMPQTANGLGVDPDDPLQNIAGAAYHLRILLDRFAGRDRETRYRLALAAYNAGTAAVDRYRGVPPYPETIAYVARVMALWHRLAGE